MIINSLKVKQRHNWMNSKQLSHFIWNHYNPDNHWRKGLVIHHKDWDSLNDHISNLELMSKSDHIKLHHTGSKHSEETKKKISLKAIGNKNAIGNKSMFGKYHSEESKLKNRLSNLGKIVSEETKKKMSLSKIGNKSMLGKKHSEETKKKMSLVRIGKHRGVYKKKGRL